MRDFLKYWGLVVSRAWATTWVQIIERKLSSIVRDAIMTGAAVFVFLYLVSVLKKLTPPINASESVADYVLWFFAALITIVAVFGVWFVIQAIFITPYVIWKENVEALKAENIKAGVQGPDLGKWLELDPLELGQVAWLWRGRVPAGKFGRDPDVMFQFSKLKRAIEAGDIVPDFPPLVMTVFRMQQHGTAISGKHSKGDLEITAKTPVKVAELRRYAESIGERPEFLFPEEHRQPTLALEIIYNNEPPPLLDKAKSITYSIGVRNTTTDRSIGEVCLRALPSLFTAQVIAEAKFAQGYWARRQPTLFEADVLHPGVTEFTELFGLPTADLSNPENEALGRPQQFELELMGRDVPAVRATFEYNPKAAHKIRRIS